MAKIIKKLTASEVKNAKPRDKEWYLFDGDGLQLTIKPNGSKLWHFKYQSPISRKRRLVSFGSANDLSLADVREKVRDWRNIIKKGDDPKEHFENEANQKTHRAKNTFGKMYLRWMEHKARIYKPKTIHNQNLSMKKHVLPSIEDIPLDDITVSVIVDVLKPLEDKECYSLISTLLLILNDVMNMAVNYQYLKSNPLIKMQKLYKRNEVKHYNAVAVADLPTLFKEIDCLNSYEICKLAFKWQLITMVRPNEATKTRWDEFDFEQGLWVIPKERMKMGREHTVPLTDLMLKLLGRLKYLSNGSQYVFYSPSTREDKPVNKEIVNTLIRKTSFKGKATSHGLRALASTVLNEHEFNPDIIETLLAHAVGNVVRRTYDRSKYNKQKLEYLTWWGDFCVNEGLILF